MATIEKRGTGYMARVSLKVNGKYERKSKAGFKTKAQAKAWATEQEALKIQGRNVLGSNQLFADYFENWFKLYKTDITDSSLRWYKYTHKLLIEYLPDVTLEGLTRPVMQSFFNNLGEKFAYSTSKKIRMYVRSAIKNAIYDDLIHKDPTIGIVITGKANKSKELKFLEESQMSQLVNYIQDIPNEQRSISDQMILVALNTGARYQEIAALTWADVSDGTISINKAWEQMFKSIKETKTKTSNRDVDVPIHLTNDLLSWKPYKNKHEFMFSYDGNIPVSSAAPNKRLKHILKEIHSPKIITFHGLRHTHASWLLSQGIDTQYVSERLGHSSVSITLDVYTHLLHNKREKETEKSVHLLNKIGTE